MIYVITQPSIISSIRVFWPWMPGNKFTDSFMIKPITYIDIQANALRHKPNLLSILNSTPHGEIFLDNQESSRYVLTYNGSTHFRDIVDHLYQTNILSIEDRTAIEQEIVAVENNAAYRKKIDALLAVFTLEQQELMLVALNSRFSSPAIELEEFVSVFLKYMNSDPDFDTLLAQARLFLLHTRPPGLSLTELASMYVFFFTHPLSLKSIYAYYSERGNYPNDEHLLNFFEFLTKIVNLTGSISEMECSVITLGALPYLTKPIVSGYEILEKNKLLPEITAFIRGRHNNPLYGAMHCHREFLGNVKTLCKLNQLGLLDTKYWLVTEVKHGFPCSRWDLLNSMKLIETKEDGAILNYLPFLFDLFSRFDGSRIAQWQLDKTILLIRYFLRQGYFPPQPQQIDHHIFQFFIEIYQMEDREFSPSNWTKLNEILPRIEKITGKIGLTGIPLLLEKLDYLYMTHYIESLTLSVEAGAESIYRLRSTIEKHMAKHGITHIETFPEAVERLTKEEKWQEMMQKNSYLIATAAENELNAANTAIAALETMPVEAEQAAVVQPLPFRVLDNFIRQDARIKLLFWQNEVQVEQIALIKPNTSP